MRKVFVVVEVDLPIKKNINSSQNEGDRIPIFATSTSSVSTCTVLASSRVLVILVRYGMYLSRVRYTNVTYSVLCKY